MRRVARLIAALSFGLLGSGLLAPTGARAESALWTMTASPLLATTGVATTFTLTATNQDTTAALLSSSEIGCLVVSVPGNFAVAATAVTGSNAGGSWTSSLAGNTVKVWAVAGGDRLAYLQWVSFTVRATATSVGSIAWNARAYRQQDCSGSGTALGVPPVVVVSGPAVTPTPVPTPVPVSTPTPTPRPTATPILPLPSLPLPSVLPSQGLPTPTPTPTLPITPGTTPSPTPRPGDSARSPEDVPGSAPGAGHGGAGQSSQGSQPPTQTGGNTGSSIAPSLGGTAVIAPSSNAPRIAFDEASFEVSLGTGGILGGLGSWAVPAAGVAFPGLLILLWVAVQTVGALAWMPAVKRLRGEDAQPVT